MMDCYDMMKEKAIVLPTPPPRGGIYSPMVRVGEKLYYTAGMGCKRDGRFMCIGQVGTDVTIEQAQEAARQCILNLLSNIQNEIGDLNNIKQIVKILGFVSSADGFGEQPVVMNAASSLLIDIFGVEAGCAARTAIGTNALPGNQSVEIEIVFEIK